MGIKVCGHRVLVRPFKLEEVDDAFKRAKAAGIQFVDNDEMRREQNAVDKGTVVSIGDTAFKDFGGDPWCKVGDLVAFAKYAGKYIEDPATKEKYLTVNDEDIIAVLTQETV